MLPSFVVHDTEAALDVTPELDTPLITGGVVSGVGVGVDWLTGVWLVTGFAGEDTAPRFGAGVGAGVAAGRF